MELALAEIEYLVYQMYGLKEEEIVIGEIV